MAILWVMRPSYSIKRHFFIIEDESLNVDSICIPFEKRGYTISTENDACVMRNAYGKIILRGCFDNVTPQYCGGAVLPSRSTISHSKAFQNVLKILGAFLMVSFVSYMGLWFIALVSGVFGGWSTVFLIDRIMPYDFWWTFFINPFLLLIVYLFEDQYISRRNYHDFSQIYTGIVDIFKSMYPHLSVVTSDVKPKLRDSKQIQSALPRLRVEQLMRLGFQVEFPLYERCEIISAQ